MPNKIESDSILRDRQDKLQDTADLSNAEYVTQLEKTSSIMPPEKPFETEEAQKTQETDPRQDVAVNDEFAQQVKEATYEVDRVDKSNEVKLHMLNTEYQKVADKLGYEALSKADKANLRSLLDDVQDKIELYQSKLKAGAMGTKGSDAEMEGSGEDGEGGEGAEGDVIMDAAKDQLLSGAILLAGKKEEEEEEEVETEEKERDQ